MNTTISNLLDNLNNQQKEVVYSKGRRLLCLAGAGTGKTHTIICKMLYNTEILKLDPRKILAVTFTNAAGKEMESRFLKYSSSEVSPTFGTFHSFCYKVLSESKEVREKLGYSSIPEIISDLEEKTFESTAKILTNVKLPKYAYKITYQPKSSEVFEYKIFQKMMDRLLKQSNKITFDRLCYRICDLFKSLDSSVKKFKDQYSYVYVDEFQDTDPLQWEFVQSFLPTCSVILVGDVRQAIYQFRGSDSSIIKKISADSDWEVIKLENNYRSTNTICQYANEFTRNYKDDLPELNLISNREEDFDISYPNENEFINNPFKYIDYKNSCAIISRTNAEVKELSEIFTSKDIKFRTKNRLKFNYIAACALDFNYRISTLINLLPEEVKSKIIRKQYLDKNFDPYPTLCNHLPDIVAQIEEVYEFDEFGQIQMLYDSGDISIYDLVDSSYQDNLGLYIGTIHSVKGLEFDQVIVYGVNSKSFNVMSSEEMMNLYYVACTRPKYKLTIVKSN